MANIHRAERAAAPSSPARHDLAEALLDLRAAEKTAAAARTPVTRLELEIAAEAAARDRLAALDAGYAAQMAAWADSGSGEAPVPDLAARAEAREALDAAALRAEAARTALAAIQAETASTEGRVATARGRIKPAIAAVLREEGSWLIAEYWRRYADLEEVRRELAALDQVLLTDFPSIHAPTGRTIVDWLSPDKLPPQDIGRAVDSACAGLKSLLTLTQRWREMVDTWATMSIPTQDHLALHPTTETNKDRFLWSGRGMLSYVA